ncbi:ribosome-associated protein, partial [Francisella tularensis subsp. holarctica]|nr:ribosome-associated protein [Francisella tularensis subsp. holarctica]
LEKNTTNKSFREIFKLLRWLYV